MAKNITIAKLDMDTEALVKGLQKTTQQIEDLRDKQEKLAQKGKEGTLQFLANEAALKSLTAAQRLQTQALSAQITEDGKLVSVKKAVKEAVNEVNNSENDYVANNKRLLELKKQLNSNDDDYEKRLANINAKLLENNNWLEENGSAHAKLITTMDDYKQQVADSFDQINILNGGFSGFVSRAQEAGGVGPLLKGSFEGITGGIKGMGKAVMANPLGALLAVGLVVIDMLKSFTPVVEKVETVMTAINAVTESVINAFTGLLSGTESLSSFFSVFTGGAAEAANAAIDLKKAQEDLAKAAELQEVKNNEAAKSIEGYIDKVNDQTLSEKERMAALAEATALEKKNYEERKGIADQTYNNAVNQIAIGKNLTAEELKDLQTKGFAYAQQLAERKNISAEELKTLKDAQLKRSDIYAEENTMLHKQAEQERNVKAKIKADNEAREREIAQKQKERQDKALALQKNKLSLFEAESEAKNKSLNEQLKYEDEYAKKSLDILRNELGLKKISYEEYMAAVLGATRTREQNKLQIASDYATAMLELYREQHQSLIGADKELTSAAIEAEKERLDYIRKQQLAILTGNKTYDQDSLIAKQKSGKSLFEEEAKYLTESLRINREYEEQIAANTNAYKDSEKRKLQEDRNEKAQERAAQYEIDMANATTLKEQEKLTDQLEYEEKKAEFEARLQDELITKETYKVLLDKLEDDKKDKQLQREKDIADFKMQQQSKLMGDMATILGKESKAGKAFSIAQTTVDTYLGAQKAYTSQLIPADPTSPVRAAIAAGAAVVAGLKNVQKIAGVKDPKFEKGGLLSVGGNRHIAGGTLFTGSDGTRFEAEQGEIIGVLNRNAARHFMAFNNAFPAGGPSAPNYFAGGGIVSREIAQQNLNTDELAMKIAAANRNLPPPVVAVQDIITEGNSYVRVRDAANF